MPLILSLLACTPEPLPTPTPPDPHLTLTSISPTLCADPTLLTATAPTFADHTATATVLLDDLPTTFSVDVGPDGRLTIDKASLALPLDLLCTQPPEPCSFDLTLALEALIDDKLVQVLDAAPIEFIDDRVDRFPDVDGDGFGALEPFAICQETPGFLDVSGDCNDTSADAFPGGTPTWCDGVDNDCIDGEEYVADRDGLAPGTSPAEQLAWALAHGPDANNISLCPAEYRGAFELDDRVLSLHGESGTTFVPVGGPALTLVDADPTISGIFFDGQQGDPTGCLRLVNSDLDLQISSFRGCVAPRGGAIDIDATSNLLWTSGRCSLSMADTAGGCMHVRGTAALVEVDLYANEAPRGGALSIDGRAVWRSGTCSGHEAVLGGCMAVSPGASLELGSVGSDAPFFTTDNVAEQGAHAYVEGLLQIYSATFEPTGVPGDDVVLAGDGSVCIWPEVCP